MRIINAKAEIWKPKPTLDAVNTIYRAIDAAGRTCYKSKDPAVETIEKEIECIKKDLSLSPTKQVKLLEGLRKDLEKAQNESARKFVRRLITNGHEAMLEHAFMTVLFTVDRGVSHELVRHRIASFAQSSTRYCNYSKDKFGNEITVIKPCFWEENSPEYNDWVMAMRYAEQQYFSLLKQGATPEQARSVLPNSLMTEVVMTMNMREARHFFKLRAAGVTGKPHPQMVEVAVPLLRECQKLMPELFDDIPVNENG